MTTTTHTESAVDTAPPTHAKHGAPSRMAITHEMREHFKHHVEHYCHILPEQGPMSITFVHNNTLFGLQKSHFEEAIEEAKQFLRAQGYVSNEVNRERYRIGRINDVDLDWTFPRRKNLDLKKTVVSLSGREVLSGEVYRTHLVRAIDPIGVAELRHQVQAEGATRKFRADLPQATRDALLGNAKAELAKAKARIGVDWTLSDWLQGQLDLSLLERQTTEVRNGLSEGRSIDMASDFLLRRLEVPADRWPGYRTCIERHIAAAGIACPAPQRDQACRIWLQSEIDSIGGVARRQFDLDGTYGAIVGHFENNPEEYAASAIWGAALRLLGLSDPFSATEADRLQDRDTEASSAETLADLHHYMERWGGPPIPVSQDVRMAIAEIVRDELAQIGGKADAKTADALERAHLCWMILHDLAEKHINRRGHEALDALVSLRGARGIASEAELVEQLRARDPRVAMQAHAQERLATDIAALAGGKSHANLIQDLTGENIVEKVNQYMVKVLTAFFDEGLSAWHLPGRALGFFESWRNLVLSDSSFDFDDLPDWRQGVHHMPTLAVDQVIRQLQYLGVEEKNWAQYCAPILADFKGWAGMSYWREAHPNYPKQQARPIDIMQYLAVRLFYQSLLVSRACRLHWQMHPGVGDIEQYFSVHQSEYFVRRQLYAGELPDYLAERARLLADASAGFSPDESDRWRSLADMVWMHRESQATARAAADQGWRLFQLSQFLGLGASELRAVGAAGTQTLLKTLDEFPGTMHGPVWLIAFEFHYRTEVLNGMRQNVGRSLWRKREKRPRFQVILCIDEREENVHRALAELDPEVESFGAAGFMGVVHDHTAFDSHYGFPLCPAVRTPAHRTYEVPRDAELETTYPVHKRRVQWLEAMHDALWELKRNVVGSYFMINLLGILHAVPLLGRLFFPLRYASVLESAHAAFVPEVKTRLTITRVGEAEAKKHNLPMAGKPIGFTIEEQVNMMETLLRNLGLTHNFAPIIFTTAHGSNSLNNPHENAHDCGACSGKHGAPNARAQAVMVNNPAVRDGLRTRGIDITDDTWFIGAEHNTASSLISLFDAQDIPQHLRERFNYAYETFQQAARLAARERCRRFGSAPKDQSPEVSLEHVLGRSLDLSQVRPEWGHCTNAFAIVGRRSVCDGLFYDRRGFNISYDPTQDPDGKILERTLLAVGPVGAGINLEYYFSTVDTKRYGSDTKVPHNVTGMFAIMEGAASDLRTGLPSQMTEVHEAMRLQVIAETTMEIAGAIYGRQPAIQELLNGEWILFTVIDPETGECNTFVPGVGFEKRDEPLTPIPTVPDSFSYYKGKYECFLPPAFVSRPAKAWKQ